ncbi:hypothetical protein FBU31_004855, partial [Coemansia sp. 'formosensis']
MYSNKRKYSDAEPHTVKRHQPASGDTFEPHITSTSTSNSSQPLLNLLCSAAEIVSEPYSSSDHQSTLGTPLPYTHNGSADETTASVVSSSGFSYIGDSPSAWAQTAMPGYLSILPPLLALPPIALGPAQANVSLQSLPPPLTSRQAPSATTRQRPKRPAMSFLCAVF